MSAGKLRSDVRIGARSSVSHHRRLCDTDYAHPSRDGGTGRRSGLKIRRYLVPWGFDSPSRHHATMKINPLVFRDTKLADSSSSGHSYGNNDINYGNLAFTANTHCD